MPENGQNKVNNKWIRYWRYWLCYLHIRSLFIFSRRSSSFSWRLPPRLASISSATPFWLIFSLWSWIEQRIWFQRSCMILNQDDEKLYLYNMSLFIHCLNECTNQTDENFLYPHFKISQLIIQEQTGTYNEFLIFSDHLLLNLAEISTQLLGNFLEKLHKSDEAIFLLFKSFLFTRWKPTVNNMRH